MGAVNLPSIHISDHEPRLPPEPGMNFTADHIESSSPHATPMNLPEPLNKAHIEVICGIRFLATLAYDPTPSPGRVLPDITLLTIESLALHAYILLAAEPLKELPRGSNDGQMFKQVTKIYLDGVCTNGGFFF